MRTGAFTATHTTHGAGYTSHHLPASRLPHTLSMLTLERRSVRTLLQALQPDLIHAHGQAAQYPWAAFDTGIATVVTVHGINGLEAEVDPRGGALRSRLRSAVWNRVEQACLHRASDIVVISPFVRSVIAPYTTARLHAIENPVEPALFELTRRHIVSHSILYVGSIQKRKGLLDLVEAVGHLHKWGIPVQLRVAGPLFAHYAAYGAAVKEVVALRGLHNHVHWLGQLDREQLRQEYDRCAVFCLPSYLEASPVVVAEAMAAGCPVVTTAIPSTAHLVTEGKHGYRVPLGDAIRLAEALHAVVSDRAAQRGFGQNARTEAAQRWSAERAAAATYALYQQMTT